MVRVTDNRIAMAFLTIVLGIGLAAAAPGLALAEGEALPKYKPSARSPEALNILSNAYGGSASAPDALQIADKVADFVLPRAGGGEVALKALRTKGPVALIFYRGHW